LVELLDDPGTLPGRRIGEAVAERLRPRRLLFGVAGAVLAVAVEIGKRLLLEGGQVTEGVRIRSSHRHVQMDSGDVLGILTAHARRHHRAPVTTLGAVAVIPQPRHQLGPRQRDVVDAPADSSGLTAPAVAGQGWADDVKGVSGVAAVSSWI